MPQAIWSALFIVVILATQSTSTSDPPCTEIFEYGQVSEGKWRANLTLISESDLRGVWVRLLSTPKFENVEVSDGYQVKYDSSEVRLARKDDQLKANVARSLEIIGTLVNGEVPKLMSIVLNGRLICSNNDEALLYDGDFNNKNYLQNLSQNIDGISFESSKCGKALLLKSIIPNDNIKVLPGYWPWQAGLFKKSNGTSTILCEATLISENSLLTAAHCVTYRNSKIAVPPSSLEVRLKNFNVAESDEDNIFKVEKIIIHSDFNEENLLNDIAIIRLEKNVGVDETTQPICLPNKGEQPEEYYVLGYGFKADGSILNLGFAKMMLMDAMKCANIEPLYRPLVNDNNFCASYSQEHEVCKGSSGSGVMGYTRGSDTETFTWELRGVLSIGRAVQKNFKCDQNSPVLIVNVADYLWWIQKNLI